MSCLCGLCKRKAGSGCVAVHIDDYCKAFKPKGVSGMCDKCDRNYGSTSTKKRKPSCPQFRLKEGYTI